MSGKPYTKEEKEWLIKNVPNKKFKTWNDLTLEFNKKFSKRNRSQLYDLSRRYLHIHRPIDSNEMTKFGNGQKMKETSAVGTEKEFGGYIWIKVNDISVGDPNKDFKLNWIQKQRYIYEKSFGRIPEGNIVIFLNGNKKDFSLSNLACIPRKYLVRLNQFKWQNRDEITKAGIKWCEHYYAIKES